MSREEKKSSVYLYIYFFKLYIYICLYVIIIRRFVSSQNFQGAYKVILINIHLLNVFRKFLKQIINLQRQYVRIYIYKFIIIYVEMY